MRWEERACGSCGLRASTCDRSQSGGNVTVDRHEQESRELRSLLLKRRSGASLNEVLAHAPFKGSRLRETRITQQVSCRLGGARGCAVGDFW
jgi:hypothetical protein